MLYVSSRASPRQHYSLIHGISDRQPMPTTWIQVTMYPYMHTHISREDLLTHSHKGKNGFSME